MKEKKVSVSDLRREADRLIASGKMPSFAEIADAIASSPAAQKLLVLRLAKRVGNPVKSFAGQSRKFVEERKK